MPQFDYNYSYDPMMPGLTVRFSVPGTSQRSQPYPAILDTGADATIVPQDLLTSLGARFVRYQRMVTLSGSLDRVRIYGVTVHIGEHTVYGVRAVGLPVTLNPTADEIIIGRDVLNQLRITLDGPGEVVEIHD
jgi:predicted aspartyl protease